MAYTFETLITALKASTTTADLLTIKTQMQTDMTSAGLNATSVAQVNEWLNQILNTKTYNENMLLMNNAGPVYCAVLGLFPSEASGTVTFNDPVVIAPGVSTTGAVTTLTVTNSANTGQTASTQIPSVLITTNSRQWLTGNLAAQGEVIITAPTYSATGASVFTNAATLVIEGPPIAGANITLTNTDSFWIKTGNAKLDGNVIVGGGANTVGFNLAAIKTLAANADAVIGAHTLSTTKRAQMFLQADSATNYSTMYHRGTAAAVSGLYIANQGVIETNSANLLLINYFDGGTMSFAVGGTGAGSEALRITPGNTSGAITTFIFTKQNSTGQTASTAIPGFLFTLGSRQWLTGAITTQLEFKLTAPTYTAVGASVITTASTFDVAAPVASTNITITNPFAATLNGHVGILTSLQLGSVTTVVTSTFLKFAASTTAKSLMNLTQGVAPTSPVDGDIWREDNTDTGLKIRINGATKTIVVA